MHLQFSLDLSDILACEYIRLDASYGFGRAFALGPLRLSVWRE